jgi:hypothetical protein
VSHRLIAISQRPMRPSRWLNSIAPMVRCTRAVGSSRSSRLRTTRAVGSSRSSQGAIDPSRRLGWSSHRELDHPMVQSTRAIEQGRRSRRSSRSIGGAIDSSHWLIWIARPSRRPQPSCQSIDAASDPVHTLAQVDRTPCRSTARTRVAPITRALSLFTGAANHMARGALCRAPPVRWCARAPQSLDERVNRFSPLTPS